MSSRNACDPEAILEDFDAKFRLRVPVQGDVKIRGEDLPKRAVGQLLRYGFRGEIGSSLNLPRVYKATLLTGSSTLDAVMAMSSLV